MKIRHILALTYWSFDEALIQTYTLPYIRIIQSNLDAGSKVFLLTLEKKHLTDENRGQQSKLTEDLLATGIHWIPVNYYSYGFRALLKWTQVIASLFFLIIKEKISCIHCWATPAGSAGYILSMLTGRALIIDSYEPHAEAMVENGTWRSGSMAFKLLFWLEKRQTRRASVLIAATAGMREYAIEKYGKFDGDFYTKPACVDLELFSRKKIQDTGLRQQLDFQNKIVCVYAGKLGGIYLDHEVFDFFRIASRYWGDRFRVLLLSAHSPEEIENYCQQSGCDQSIITLKFVPHHEVAAYMGLADFAITPVKPVYTKRFCTPIKDGEYWALGLPVIIPDHISEDSTIIQLHQAGVVLNGFSDNDFRFAIENMDELLKQPGDKLHNRVRALAEKYRSFEIAREVYHKIYKVSA